MSDISFSHEFSQHWRQAPEKVKNAIVQELGDIVKLLDKETELENFSFQCADLDAYIDETYAQFIEEESGSPQVAYDQEGNNTESGGHNDTDKANLKQTNQGATATLTTDTLLNEDQSDNQILAISDNTNKTQEGGAREVKAAKSIVSNNLSTKNTGTKNVATEKTVTTSNIKPSLESENNDNPTGDPNTQSTLTKSDLSEDHAYVIQELETHIDDYLSEHMTSLSEDLKKWLHDEVKRRINSL